MRRGDKVKIKMQKVLHSGVTLNEHVYFCELLQYDEKEECLYLVTEQSELTVFSLDAIYFFEVQTETGLLQCTGRIKERSRQKVGKILKIQIENGFYKINIK